MKNTELLYLEDSYLLEWEATIVECWEKEEKWPYVVFDKTLFYPRGGWQETDTGHVIDEDESKKYIAFVWFSGWKVYHFGDVSTYRVWDVVRYEVTREHRIANAILHTAWHLIASIVETMNVWLKAVKWFHFPEGSYVQFEVAEEKSEDMETLIRYVNSQILKDIKSNSPITTKIMSYEELVNTCDYVPSNLPKDKPLRTVTIENYFPIPCGGTHTRSLWELSGLRVTKAKMKKGQLKLSYCVLP